MAKRKCKSCWERKGKTTKRKKKGEVEGRERPSASLRLRPTRASWTNRPAHTPLGRRSPPSPVQPTEGARPRVAAGPPRRPRLYRRRGEDKGSPTPRAPSPLTHLPPLPQIQLSPLPLLRSREETDAVAAVLRRPHGHQDPFASPTCPTALPPSATPPRRAARRRAPQNAPPASSSTSDHRSSPASIHCTTAPKPPRATVCAAR